MNKRVSICCGFFLLTAIAFSLVSNAQTRSTLTVKGLRAGVEVVRDRWGVNHIYAGNQHDLFFAQGYCAAKDRLFQFEIWRRQATGTLSEILGARAVKKDVGARLFRFRGDMRRELASYHRDGAAIISAYVDGVNAYIDSVNRQPQRLPVEFQLLKIVPGRWTPEVVISRHNGIRYNVQEELNIGRAIALKGKDAVKKLLVLQPDNPDLELDSALTADVLRQNILELYQATQEDLSFVRDDIPGDRSGKITEHDRSLEITAALSDERGIEGSNNWTVSAKRAANGATMLANDPHRKISIPSLRYIVHLVAPGWNVIGGGEPEIPGVSIGHNEHGAWGLTIHQTDVEDLYVYELNPANLHQYKYEREWRDFKDVQEVIKIKNAGDINITLHYSVHGPVTFIDTARRKAFAVKCGWLEPGAAPYLASLRLDQADSWSAFRNACSYFLLPSLNMVWADKLGNIGWQVVGIIPRRENFSGLVPVPGNGQYEWSGYLPVGERPHVLNPPKGYWATANQYLTPAKFAHHDAEGFTWPDAFRATRINEILAADSMMTVKKMEHLQTDYFSVPARMLVPLLRNLSTNNAAAEKSRNILLSWNYVMDKDSIAPAIYDTWERELLARARTQAVPIQLRGLINVQLTKIVDWLLGKDTSFGVDPYIDRQSFLKSTFADAVAILQTKLGNDISLWKYGQPKYKHIQFMHPLSAVIDSSAGDRLNTVAMPRGGNAYTPCSTGLSDNQATGASFRMIVDESDWDKAVMTNAPGQSGDPSSPYYKNLFDIWANDGYFPAYSTKKKILSVAAEQLLLKP